MPCVFEGLACESAGPARVISGQATGMELFLDPRAIEDKAKARGLLEQALDGAGPRAAA